MGLIELAELSPLSANVIAFSVAVLVSFFGHLHWTFRSADGEAAALRSTSHMLSKFVVVTLIGLCLNSLAVYMVTEALALPYVYAIFLIVSVVPITVFLLSKIWAFA